MKTKKLLALGLLLSFLFTQTAFAEFSWGDVFQTDQGGLTFTEYQGQLTTLSSDGYDSALVSSTDLKEFVIKIVNYALGFLGLAAVLVIIYGGVLYVSSGGDDSKVTTAKNAIKYALIGLLIILGSFAFVNTVISAGGGTQSTGQIRKITSGRTATGFNSSAEEVKQLAADIYNGFSSLSDITLEFKSIQNDASKTALLPSNLPSKATILSYLTGVRAKLSSISTKVPQYSESYISLKRIERELERQIDTVKSLNQSEKAMWKNGTYDSCDGDIGFTDAILGNDPCEGYVTYTKNLFEFWGKAGTTKTYDQMDLPDSVFNDNSGNFKSVQQVWVDGLILSPIIDSIKEEYIKILGESFYRLLAIEQDIGRYFGTSAGSDSQNDFTRMKTSYGISSVLFDGDYKVNPLGGQNFYNKILEWKLGSIDEDPIGEANYSLEQALTIQAKIYRDISTLKFVEAKLTANVIEGSAPLTVIFDALATSDPAGGSLNKENIIWDLGGTRTINQMMYTSDYGTIISSDNVTCDREGVILTSEEMEQDQKIGLTAQRCTFQKPGTYKAAIKIRSNESGTYAPGISIITIKVNPPNTKIDLVMTPSGSDPIVLMQYNEDDTLETSKNKVAITLEQAKSGILFDASKTYAESYKWDFGNGEKTEFTGSPTATAIYSQSGRYSVKLEVMSKLGVIDRKVFTLEISDLSARIIDNNKGKGVINTDIIFDGSGSRSDRGGIRSYAWLITASSGQKKPEDFEKIEKEGTTLSKFLYKFKYPLQYDIQLTVTDVNGNVSTDTLNNFEVTSQKPIAQYTYKELGANKPATIKFNSDASFDPDGDSKFLIYEWAINTNDTNYVYVDNTSENSKNPVIQFLQKGEYEVTLKVTDLLTSGQSEEYGKISKTINIDSILDIEWSPNSENSQVLNDEGFAEIKFGLLSTNAVAYEIDFGDGDTESGEFSQSKQITHQYTKSGKFTVLATVYNSEEDDNNISKTIFIGDKDTPIAKISVLLDGTAVYDFEELIEVSKKTKITFDASESKNTDGTGRKLNYSWDFGDTTRSSEKTAIHSYSELSPDDTGFFTAKLTATDKDNSNISATDKIQINVVNMAPKFSSLQGIPRTERGNMTTPITTLMKVYGAEDPDGRITQYRWWYYDLENPDNELGSIITTVDNAQLIIGTNGQEGDEIEYGFGVELTDNDNLSYSSMDLYDENTVPKVKVINGPNVLPTAKFSVNATKVFLGDPIIFTSTSEDKDGSILAYIWDLEGDGFYNNAPTDQPTIEHVFAEKNLKGYDVRLKVRDDKGGEAVSPIIKVYVDAKSNPPVPEFEATFPDPTNKLKVQFRDKSTVDESVGAKLAQTLWDFDLNKDTSGDMIRNNDIDARTSNPIWTYDTYGIYKVKLQVVDSMGEKSEITKDVVLGEIQNNTPTTDTKFIPTASLGDDPTPPVETGVVLEDVKASLSITPSTIEGETGIVVLDFSKSTGPIKYYKIDKNIYFDSLPYNGIPDDDFDYITTTAGTWQTNFDKSWGEIAVKLTVIREDGKEDTIVKKVIFK